jgi:hypothetical protein
MYSDEAESFAKFPAYVERFRAADLENYCKIATQKETGQFQAAFFALVGLRYAHENLMEFISINSTHMGSKFKMMLLIACGIDANNKTLPLAWALVLIECSTWWRWFIKYLKKAFRDINNEGFIIILDREKGLLGVLNELVLGAVQAYCCQHIADNVKNKFRIKC